MPAHRRGSSFLPFFRFSSPLTATSVQQHLEHGARAQRGAHDVGDGLGGECGRGDRGKTDGIGGGGGDKQASHATLGRTVACGLTPADDARPHRPNQRPRWAPALPPRLTFAAAMLPNWAFLPDSRLAVVVSTWTGACMVGAGEGMRKGKRAAARRPMEKRKEECVSTSGRRRVFFFAKERRAPVFFAELRADAHTPRHPCP
jgi:hypothetical protein